MAAVCSWLGSTIQHTLNPHTAARYQLDAEERKYLSWLSGGGLEKGAPREVLMFFQMFAYFYVYVCTGILHTSAIEMRKECALRAFHISMAHVECAVRAFHIKECALRAAYVCVHASTLHTSIYVC